MSHPLRLVASSTEAPKSLREESGIRPIPAGIEAARRAWEEEDRLEEAAALAMFEWHMFLTELDPEPRPEPAPLGLAAPLANAGAGHVAPRAAARAEGARRPRKAQVQRVGLAVVALAYAVLVAVAATPVGGRAIGSWMTLGHDGDVRQVMAQVRALSWSGSGDMGD